MKPQPIAFLWDGEVMRPLPPYINVAARQFGEPGSEHVLEPTNERSMASHNQYFAALHDAFTNLPESVAARWPTVEHFRKWCLIKCDYCDEKEIICISEQKATETALWIRDIDEYALIHVHGCKVLVRRARSQTRSKMQKEEFEASKKAVLDLAEHFTGVPRGQAMKEAGRNA